MLAVFMGMPGWAELIVVAVVGLLIFGRRLPEVGRSLGKGIVEFKKGLAGIEDEMDNSALPSADKNAQSLPDSSEHGEPTVLNSSESEHAPMTEHGPMTEHPPNSPNDR